MTLFDSLLPSREELGPEATLLRGFALREDSALVTAIHSIAEASPFRHMTTPGGFRMSVAMTNCGPLGWITDRKGYRYAPVDPENGSAWPAMPEAFRQLAIHAAREAGFTHFTPDACMINRYEPGTKMSLHQDKNEIDYSQPIVSVSLGMPATFLFGGAERSDKAVRVPVAHGDVIVWGGASRLRYHGILPLALHPHPLTGACRFNLTFRKAG